MTPDRAHRSNAFTLVELLVAVSIIAILIAVLLPSLRKARAQAKLAVCASNLKQIGAAIHLYAHDQNGLIPRGPAPAEPPNPWDFATSDIATNQLWIGAGAPMHPAEFNGLGRLLTSVTAQARVFFCPADDNFNLGEEAPRLYGTEDSFGSYMYRQLDHLPENAARGRLDQMGINRVAGRDVRVEALALDMNSLGPGSFGHTNHRARQANVLFRDSSVSGFGRAETLFAIPAAAFTDFSQLKPSIDQILTNADFAYRNGPSNAPQVTPAG